MSAAGPRRTQGWGFSRHPMAQSSSVCPRLSWCPGHPSPPSAASSSCPVYSSLVPVSLPFPSALPCWSPLSSPSHPVQLSLLPVWPPLPASTPQPIPIVTNVPPVYLSLLPVSPSLPQYTPAWPKCPSHSPGIPQPSPSVTIIPSSMRQPAPVVIPFHPVHPSMNPIPSSIPQYEPHSFQYTPAYHPQCLPHSLTPPTPHPGVTPKPPKTQTQFWGGCGGSVTSWSRAWGGRRGRGGRAHPDSVPQASTRAGRRR